MTQKELEEFKSELLKKTPEELKKMEAEIIAEAEENDKKLSTTEFVLPEENYSEVASSIRHFFDDKAVTWQYVGGMITLYEFWNPEVFPGKILFPVLDATLRTLGESQFKGYADLTKVSEINKYFEPIRDAYIETATNTFDIANRHSALVEAMQIATPMKNSAE